jgi:hypothetical protein
MTRSVLLDPATGRPEGADAERPFTLVTLRARSDRMGALREANPGHEGFAVRDEMNTAAYKRAMRRAPQRVLDLLERSIRPSGRAMKEMQLGGRNAWEEVVCAIVADGAANATTAEAAGSLLIPDARNYVFPGGPAGLAAGSCVKVSARGVLTTDASAGTLLFRERYGATGNGHAGTLLAAQTTALAPTNSQTNASWHVEFITTVRANPDTAVGSITHGFASYPGQSKVLIPATGAASVNIDTTQPRLFAVTAVWSAAESLTCQQYIVEWMN